MKRNDNPSGTFGLMSMFSNYAATKGVALTDSTAIPTFFDHLKRDLKGHLENPARIYGLHAEAMFAYVAAALSNCRLITQEDAGIFFSRTQGIQRPDFRLITDNDKQFLVEVKNYYQSDPFAPYKITPEYIASLREYATIAGCCLMLSIYWSKWKLWTMVDIAHLPASGILDMGEAIKRNQMGLLGDCMVSTVPPLSLRFTSDPTKPRTLDENGNVCVTIGGVDLYANGRLVNRPIEKKIAWFFMRYSQWTEIDHPAMIKDRKLDYFEITINPPDRPVEEPFCALGYLSQMISRQYIDMTSEEECVKFLMPDQDPNNLGVLIPKDYKGEALKLWLFNQLPSRKDLDDAENNQ